MTTSILHTQAFGTSYSDSFWDDQGKGVDIVINKSRQSKESCEAIKRLYKARAQIEEEYGDKLLKLIQSSEIGQLEEGTFAETLSHISSALETTARTHMDLAQQLKDHLESPLDGFIKEQRDLRKVQQQQIENSKQLKHLHETDVARAREYYASECTKLSVMEAQFASEEDQVEGSINFEKEIEEQKRMVAVADQVFKRSTDSFNKVNDKWISDWKKASSVFQDMEIKRINYLRNTLWTYSNIMTNTSNIDEDSCDRIRTALEITDVEKDILGFVQRYGTGTKAPAPVFHEPLYASTSHSSLPAPTPKASLDSQNRNINSHTNINNNMNNMNRSDSAVRSSSQPPVTILTNPDEELKSVDHQLQQLEVIGKPTELSPEQLSPPQSPAVAIIKEQLNEATPTTVSHGAVSTAMKEVEHMLEQQQGSHSQVNQHKHMDSNTASNDKELPQIEPPSPVQVKSAPIVETPEPLSTGPSLPLPIQDMNDTSNNPIKFKPMPNPDFEKASSTQDHHLVLPENIEKKEYLPELLSAEEHTEITMRHDRSLSAQEIRLEDNNKSENKEVNNNSNKREDIKKNKENQVDDDDDDDEEEEEVLYKSRLPRSTPKDEKWVISSIRRPQQLPVRAVNAKMSDGSMNRNSMSPPVNQGEEQLVAEEKPKEEEARQPKLHRPLVPLTIDIPNAINKAPSHPNIHTITQAVVEDNRRHSHPSPIQQQPMELTYHAAPTDRNMIRSYINQTSNPMNPEIRPAPWLDEGGNVIDEQQPYRPPSNNNHSSYYGNARGYPQQYVGPRGSSLKMNPEQLQQLHQELYQHDDDNNKKRPTPVAKLQNEKHKDSKAGRFSLPFFGGKKDKKKEKEAAAVAAKEVASAPTSFYGNTSYRPPPQDAYHRPQSQVVYQLPQQVHSPPPQVQSPPLIQQQQVPPEMIETTIATANLPPSQQQQEQTPSSESDNRNCIGYARALWTFEANIEEEMSFQAGDTIGIIRKQTDGWWVAQLTKQGVVHQGLVPGNYMEPIQS